MGMGMHMGYPPGPWPPQPYHGGGNQPYRPCGGWDRNGGRREDYNSGPRQPSMHDRIDKIANTQSLIRRQEIDAGKRR